MKTAPDRLILPNHAGIEMADTAAERRLQRQIDSHRENEARWLQKVMFAMGKARDAREKLAEATNEQLNPLITLDNGDQIPLNMLEEIIQKRVDDLNITLGRGVYTNRK
jgi:U3 small nucleolar RNA-associated protein 14